MGRPIPPTSDAVKGLELAVTLILLKDGDRDEDNHSDLTVEQALAIYDVCRSSLALIKELQEDLLEADKVNPGVLKAVARRLGRAVF